MIMYQIVFVMLWWEISFS